MSLLTWGWSEYFQREFSLIGEGQPARVVSQDHGVCSAAAETGEIPCFVRKGVRPVTGDWVVYDPALSVITHVLPRRTWLSRKKAGREVEEQVLATNIDVVFIVTALDADFSLRRLERYLVVAREGGVTPVIVLNKQDQCADPLAKLREVDALTSGLVPVLLTSALDRATVQQLHRYLETGQTAALLGSSGVGKSTIVNQLLGEAVQAVSAVREGDSKGRHTTTGRQLFPLKAGWLLMDTPGLREIEPWAQASSVDTVFDDITEAGLACRFRDCRHQQEPGCAVQQAILEGRLEPARLSSFRNLKGAMSALEKKREWRAIHRAMKRMPDKRDIPE